VSTNADLKERARQKAIDLSTLELVAKLRYFADDVEAEGRTHLPALLREAAQRLDRGVPK
jgi:hypothetical protein